MQFSSPEIIYGEDALDFLQNIEGKKYFIVTDKNIQDLGYLKILIEKLQELGKNYTIFNDVKPDPQEAIVLQAKEKCLAYEPNIIIALGGGSVIDTAKGTWALYEFPEFEIDDLHIFNKKLYELGKKAKLIAIPTTSGTGADATYAAVISREYEGVWQKLIQAHRGLVPTYSILDPRFPLGMPAPLTINTGMDILAHAMEALIANGRNEFSNTLATKAIELVFHYLPVVVDDGANIEARNYIHQAATMAGLAFGNANVHIGHTTGHSLGAVFQVSHGKSVGIMLKYATQYCLNNPNEKDPTIGIYAKLAKHLGWAKWDDNDTRAAHMVITKLADLQKTVGFPGNLQEISISKNELEQKLDTLVKLCFQDASGSMSPRLPSKADFENLYRYAYEGKDIDF